MKYFCQGCGEVPNEEDVKTFEGKLIHDVSYCRCVVVDLDEETATTYEERNQKAIQDAVERLKREQD